MAADHSLRQPHRCEQCRHAREDRRIARRHPIEQARHPPRQHQRRRQSGSDPDGLAVLKRRSQKDVKAVAAEVYKMEDGPMVLYLFPPSAEIGRNDRQVRFEVQIGRIAVGQVFNLDEMKYLGKLELGTIRPARL